MKKKFVFVTILIVITIVGSAFLILNSVPKQLTDSQKENALAKILGRKPNLGDKNVPTGNTQYKGKYIIFMYPKRAKIYTQMLNGKPIKQTNLESFIFDLDDPKITVVTAVTTVVQNVQNVSDYPSVKLRQIENNIYTQDKIQADGIEGLVFTKQDIKENEKSGFFYKNSKVFSISVLGNDFIEVQKIFKDITSTIKFLGS